MPKYRKLHTKVIESLDVNELPDDFSRLMWVLLPLALCREGRGLDNPSWLKSKIFPLRIDVTLEQVQETMDCFAKRGMVEYYQVEGRGYFHVPTFHKYQGNTVKEAESDYPPPPEQDAQETEASQEQVGSNSGASQEQGESKSATDSIFNIQYADTDSVAPESVQTEETAERDFLDDALTFSRKQSGNEKRPRGWQDGITDAEYAVCRRVAQHWGTGKLPAKSDLIDDWAAGAKELLRHHDGDELATLLTLDQYQVHYDAEAERLEAQNKTMFTVGGPQSLMQVIPAFMARQRTRGSPAAEPDMQADPQYAAFAEEET